MVILYATVKLMTVVLTSPIATSLLLDGTLIHLALVFDQTSKFSLDLKNNEFHFVVSDISKISNGNFERGTFVCIMR